MTPKSVTKKSGSRHLGRQTATGQTRSVRGVRRSREVPGRAAGWRKAQPLQESLVNSTTPRPAPAGVQAAGPPVAARRTMRTGGNRARPRRRLPDHCHRAGPGASTRRPNTPARSTAAKPAARRPRRRDRAPATAAWRGRIGGKALQRTSTNLTRHDRMHENSASMLGSSISRRISGRIHRTHSSDASVDASVQAPARAPGQRPHRARSCNAARYDPPQRGQRATPFRRPR